MAVASDKFKLLRGNKNLTVQILIDMRDELNTSLDRAEYLCSWSYRLLNEIYPNAESKNRRDSDNFILTWFLEVYGITVDKIPADHKERGYFGTILYAWNNQQRLEFINTILERIS